MDKSDHQCFHIEKIFTKLSHIVVKSEVIYSCTSPIIILSRAMRDRRNAQKPWGTTPLQMPGAGGIYTSRFFQERQDFFRERGEGPGWTWVLGIPWSRFWDQGLGWAALALCHIAFASQPLWAPETRWQDSHQGSLDKVRGGWDARLQILRP